MQQVLIYHYEMGDKDLGFRLMLQPDPEDVRQAWNAEKYRLAYAFGIEGGFDNEVLEAAFAKSQDTGKARSTSVGDVIVLVRDNLVFESFVVSSVGFKPVPRG